MRRGVPRGRLVWILIYGPSKGVTGETSGSGQGIPVSVVGGVPCASLWYRVSSYIIYAHIVLRIRLIFIFWEKGVGIGGMGI